MRTKTLFLSAAALAAGVLSSMAQANVYSVNVVGYVNVKIPANQFILLANPLDNGTNDTVTLAAALPNKSSIQTWNGTGFDVANKTLGNWSVNLPIPVGRGFFLRSPDPITNTFVGSVLVNFGATNTAALPEGTFTLVGSRIPVAGALNDSGPNTLNIGSVLPNKSSIQTWTGTGFNVANKTLGAWSTNLPIGVAEGFFVKSASATNWSQTLQ